MILWKTSIGNLKYYLARFPSNNFYTSTSPVKSPLEARGEAALGATLMLQHQAVLAGIWSGVKNLEPQIAQRFRHARGVLVVALISEADITNPDVQVPQKMYQNAWIGGAGNDYPAVAGSYALTPSLIPGSPSGWHNTYAHIWASKN